MDELRGKILAVIGRVGVTDIAAEIIIDLVSHALQEAGRMEESARRVRKRPVRALRASDPDPNPGLFPEKTPDPSQPTKLIPTVMSAPPTVALVRCNPFAEGLRIFGEIWRHRYGVPYEPTPRDRNQLGRLLQAVPHDRLTELWGAFRNYLQDHSPFVAQEMRHALWYFCTSGGWNKYRTAPVLVTQKEARTLAAGDAWLAMRRGSNDQR